MLLTREQIKLSGFAIRVRNSWRALDIAPQSVLNIFSFYGFQVIEINKSLAIQNIILIREIETLNYLLSSLGNESHDIRKQKEWLKLSFEKGKLYYKTF